MSRGAQPNSMQASSCKMQPQVPTTSGKVIESCRQAAGTQITNCLCTTTHTSACIESHHHHHIKSSHEQQHKQQQQQQAHSQRTATTGPHRSSAAMGRHRKRSLASFALASQIVHAIIILLISSSQLSHYLRHGAQSAAISAAFASTLPATLSSRDHISHSVQPRGLVTTPAKHPAIRPPATNTRGHLHSKTTYACEGNQLDLTCDDKKSIHLVRANYGRFSLSICNDGGFSNLSVNCMSYRSFLVMQDRCSQQSNCSVVVSSSMFGDPCPDTSKYLEVQYYCVDAATNGSSSTGNGQQQQSTTSLPLTQSPSSISGTPINQRNNNNNNNGNNKPDTTLAITVITGNNTGGYDNVIQQAATTTNNKSVAVKKSDSTSPQSPLPANMSPTNNNNNRPLLSDYNQSNLANQIWQPNSSGNNNQDQENNDTNNGAQNNQFANNRDYCQPSKTRHLYWNYTRRGYTNTQKCPPGSIGRVEWQCDYNEVKFVPQTGPDYTDCKSIWLDNLESQLLMALAGSSNNNGLQQQYQHRQQWLNSLTKLTGELAMMTKTKELFSDDLRRISVIISQLVASLGRQSSMSWPTMQSIDSIQYREDQLYMSQLLAHVADTISGLLDNVQKYAWNDLRPLEKRLSVANKLMDNLKDCALLLAAHTRQDSKWIMAKQNVLVAIYVIDLNNRQQQLTINAQSGLKFPQADDAMDLGPWSSLIEHESVQIPAAVLADVAVHGMSRIVFIAFNRIEEYLRPDKFDHFQLLTTTGSQSTIVSLRSPVIGAFSYGPDSYLTAQQDGTLPDRAIAKSLLLPPLVQSITINFKNIHQLQQRCSAWPIITPASASNNNNNGNNNNFNGASSPSCWLDWSNSTNYVCKCDHFSYFSLLSDSIIGINSGPDGQPSTTTTNGANTLLPDATAMDNTLQLSNYPQQSSSVGNTVNGQEQSQLNSADPTNLAKSIMNGLRPATATTTNTTSWFMVLIILLVSVVVLFVILFLIGANSNNLNLFNSIGIISNNKNNGNNGDNQSRRFCGALIGHGLSVGSSSNGSNAPTTGPIIPSSNSSVGTNQTGQSPLGATIIGSMGLNTTVNGTILGLNTQTNRHTQKQISELASSNHLNLAPSSSARLFGHLYWLRPSYWLNRSKQHHHHNHHVINNGLIHHAGGVNSHLNQASSNMSFKTHPFQNGYGISGSGAHHHHHNTMRQHQHSHLPMQAPSSSTSSYMSSSVYYEEIGPSTATTITSGTGASLIPNPHHTLLANATPGQPTKTTLVDLSKMPTTTIINTGLLSDPNPLTLHHSSSNNNNLVHSSWSASYALSPQQQQQHQSAYGTACQRNDLTNNGNNGNGSTLHNSARHHLFQASTNPSSAYKSSPTMHHQQISDYKCRVYQPADGDNQHQHYNMHNRHF